ncbi:MAG: transglycosylase SLT domain-containing protein [Rhizobacter sp.]|nr:transglycosylase SLT domain-containing protein [Bacteriovorax sp.]
MKIFGLSKQHVDILKTILEKNLSSYDKTKVYIFGSRANGNFKDFSDIDIAVKLKNIKTNSLLSRIQEDLEESELPFKVDLVNWDEIAKEYLPNIKKQKLLFWTPKEIEKKSDWRICPIGEHWTRIHPYNIKSGKVAIQSGHCKKNPSGKDILKKDELELIPTLDIFKKQKIKILTNDLGFENGNDYDEIIAGWVAYWNEVFRPEELLNPNYVKILIATESGFREKIVTPNKNKNIGKALGISQITESTLKAVKNKKGELKDHYVEITKEEALDPNKNIAVGVRWLFRKYETAKKKLKRAPSWEEVIWEFKGITNDNSKKGVEIKNKIKNYLKLFNLPSNRH